mmetsp:Transcript_28627/g.53281  ORF Transcript_28627/g.53281 Transcript_28627/m.53281 type:complete len:180 (+) Transcript_28627:48-587(+)
MSSFEENASPKLLEVLGPKVDAARSLAQKYASSDDGWEQCWQKHGITASKRSVEGNQICVRGQTSYSQPPLEVFKIIQNFVELDEVVKQHDFLVKLSPSMVIDHVFLDTPWPTTPRDGLSACFIEVQDNGAISQISFGIQDDSVCAPIEGFIRSELTINAFMLLPDGQGGTTATYVIQV